MNATRRQFLQTSIAVSAFALAPQSLLGQSGGKPPGQKLNIAGIGVGGMGRNNLKPLSETVLMGNLAVRFPNQQLLWDGEHMQVTNHQEANAYVTRKYREGWTL